jgi:hypothetical protein
MNINFKHVTEKLNIKILCFLKISSKKYFLQKNLILKLKFILLKGQINIQT